MSAVGEDVSAIAGIPDLHRLIPASRGDACAIGRPYYCKHSIGMSAVGEDVPAIAGIPDLHRLICTCRGDSLPIRRPDRINYRIGIPGINEDRIVPEQPLTEDATSQGYPHCCQPYDDGPSRNPTGSWP